MILKFFFLFFCFFTMGMVWPLHAAPPYEVRLFEDDGTPSKNYNQKVQSVIHSLFKARAENLADTPGVKLLFSNGISFHVYSYLGGNQHAIFDLGSQKILRIRIQKKQLTPFIFENNVFGINKSLSQDSMRSFREGYNFLLKHNVPTTPILSPPQYDAQFFVMEKLSILFDYSDYLYMPHTLYSKIQTNASHDSTLKSLSSEELLLLADFYFYKFAHQTAHLRNIGDFREDQLVFTQEHGWILLDWDSTHNQLAKKPTDTTIFTMDRWDRLRNLVKSPLLLSLIRKPGLPQRLYSKTIHLIQSARLKSPASCINFFSN